MKIKQLTNEQKRKIRKNLKEALLVLEEIDRLKQRIADMRNSSS